MNPRIVKNGSNIVSSYTVVPQRMAFSVPRGIIDIIQPINMAFDIPATLTKEVNSVQNEETYECEYEEFNHARILHQRNDSVNPYRQASLQSCRPHRPSSGLPSPEH